MSARRISVLLLSCLLGAGGAVEVRAQRAPEGTSAAYDFALAKLLAAEGHPRQALERMQQAVRQLPRDPVLRIEYARLLLAAGRTGRAVEQVDRARKLAPRNRHVLAAVAEIHLADGARSADSFAAAQSALEALSRLPDPDPRAMVKLAEMYLRQQQPGRAAPLLRELDERLPGNRLVIAMLAEALVRSGQQAEAIRRLQGALERDPEDLKSRLRLAELQRQAGEFASEASTLAATPVPQRQGKEVQRRLSLALARSGDVEAARIPLQELVEQELATADDKLLYGRVLAALGENEAAERVLRSLLDVEPLRVAAALELAPVLERQRRGDEGVELLERTASALRRDGRIEDAALLVMARLELQADRGAWKAVADALDASVAALPEEYREGATLLLVQALRESGRAEDALELLRDPDSPLTASVREAEAVLSLHQAGRREEARRRLAEMEASGDPERLFRAGLVYREWQELERAVSLLEQASAARPGEARELYALARVYFEAGRRDDSEQALRRLLDAHPDHAAALNDLGYMLAVEGRDLERARQMTQEAVLQQPYNGAFVDSLGWVCFQLGRLDEAQKYLERAAGLLPGDPTILEHLGDLYRQRGDHGSARRAYRQALEAGVDDTAALERKLAALTQGL